MKDDPAADQRDELVEVTQADRDMAALVAWKSLGFLRELKEGLHDDSDAAQAFARHRLASERAALEQAIMVVQNPPLEFLPLRDPSQPIGADEYLKHDGFRDAQRIIATAIRNLGSSPGGMGE